MFDNIYLVLMNVLLLVDRCQRQLRDKPDASCGENTRRHPVQFPVPPSISRRLCYGLD